MSQASVLILDDEAQVGWMLRAALVSWGLTADTLQEPRRCLDLLRQHEYDVILLDVVMPHVSGMDLLASIREVCPAACVIMMTGYADKSMAIEALRMGAFDFLEKPI